MLNLILFDFFSIVLSVWIVKVRSVMYVNREFNNEAAFLIYKKKIQSDG